MKINIGYLLAKRAEMHPRKEAFVDVQKEKRHTYRQYNANTNRVANALKAKGINKGDRVALLLMNGAEYMESFFAIAI